jgi:hypothetical protein
MVVIRTIVATLIAVSVAVLPAAGMGILPEQPDQAVMLDQADMPCCPRCDPQNDRGSMVCDLTCTGVVAFVVPVSAVALPAYGGDRSPRSFAAELLREFLKAPPTHPPQL